MTEAWHDIVLVLCLVVGGLLALAAIVWLGGRSLRSGGGAGFADGLANAIDVFDPAQARADRELKSQDHQIAVTPSPDDDDRPVRVDLRTGHVRVRGAADPHS